MSRLLVVCVGLCSAVAFADVDPRFVKLRDSAKVLEGGLGTFLDKYVGECNDPLSAHDCQENAKKFRSEATGQKFYMIVSEDSVSQLSAGPYDPRGEFELNILPFFPAGGYALTQGAPKKTDAHGNPIMATLISKGTAPDTWNATSLGRYISMQAFRLQVVFTPLSVWTLRKNGGGKTQGVQAKIHGILVTSGRTGETIASWYEK